MLTPKTPANSGTNKQVNKEVKGYQENNKFGKT